MCFSTRYRFGSRVTLVTSLFFLMEDLICINHLFEAHLTSLVKMFAAFRSASLTLRSHDFRERYFCQYRPHSRNSRPTYVNVHKRSTHSLIDVVRRYVNDYADITALLVVLTRKYLLNVLDLQNLGLGSYCILYNKENVCSPTPVLLFPFIHDGLLLIPMPPDKGWA